jgi:hypothetical protein
MSNSIALLGLPGLYQNWLMSALDKDSQLTVIAERNFEYRGSKFDWYMKGQQDLKLESYDYVINLYVKEENFVWFLYNFLEKTCEIGVMVDNLVNSLYTKGIGTQAFDQLIKHFTSSYNITNDSSEDYCKNAAIEYFYFLLIEKNAEFKITAACTNNRYINIEYDDFNNVNILIDKLKQLPMFNLKHFLKCHRKLNETNVRFLKHKEEFKNKTKNFDILETAYLGYLITSQSNEQLDWFNSNLRNTRINEYLRGTNKIV